MQPPHTFTSSDPAPGARGQGLAEYALVLVLVGIVVIASLVLFGGTVRDTYCNIVRSIDPNIEAPMCPAFNVTCHIDSTNPFRMHATVSGNEAKIKHVKFYVDGNLYNTEYYVVYCLQGGDGPCAAYTGPKGKHTFTAIGEDVEGGTGQCSLTATVP